MKIILTHDVDRLGKAGDVVEVKDGYARNYLVPRGFAMKWTRGAQKQIDLIAEARRKRAIDSLEAANDVRDALDGITVNVVKAASDSGRLFAAVSTADIAAAVEAATGKVVDRRVLNVASVIKSVGSYDVTAKLHDDITASFTVAVASEGGKKGKK